LARSTKPRHVVALALVGWYLMMPPTDAEISWECGNSLTAQIARYVSGGVAKVCETEEHYTGIGYLQPLSQWHQVGEPFEHLSECEQGLHELFQAEMKDNEGKPHNEQYHTRDFGRCIASDDPRLKGN
jgi:hypothetical protein